MKDKDRAFFEALDTLKAQGINPVAAAHWTDRMLRSAGISQQQLQGWRRWFWSRVTVKERNLEIGAAPR